MPIENMNIGMILCINTERKSKQLSIFVTVSLNKIASERCLIYLQWNLLSE